MPKKRELTGHAECKNKRAGEDDKLPLKVHILQEKRTNVII